MNHTQNPASGGTLDGADCSASRQSDPYNATGAKNKAPASRRLVAAHWSPAIPETAIADALIEALKRRAGAS